jgi:hypothetical protein
MTADAEPKRLTREELYEQVWSEPLVQLAKKFGISDVALAKRCRRMRIPLPGLGYWAKKQHGKPVRRAPLPKLPANATSTEFVMREKPVVGDAPEPPHGPVADQQRFESLAENRIVVADVLADPHPLIAKTVAALRRAKPNHQGYLIPTVPALNVNVSLDGADRAMCILDALLKALDARGYETTIHPARSDETRPATVVKIGGDEVPISLTERIDVVERPDLVPPRQPTRPRRASHWDAIYAPSPPEPRRELVASGQYTLRIDISYISCRRAWTDGKQQRLEQILNSIVVGLVVAAEKLREHRLEREKREREWREAEARRIEEERRRELEAGRIRALDRVLTAWRDSRDIREYVAEARQALSGEGAPPDAAIFAWLEWVENYADRLDPVRPVPKVPKDPGPPRPSYWR